MKIKNFGTKFLAIIFPWAILLMHDNPGGALVAVILQATGVGWIPASMWAFRTLDKTNEPETEAQSPSGLNKT